MTTNATVGTPTNTKPTTPAKSTKATKTRKPVEKRGFNNIGKFFAIVRIHLGMKSDDWAKALGVSGSYINNVERGDKVFDLDFAFKVQKLLPEQFRIEFADIVAHVLNVLIIPENATADQIRAGFYGLHTKPSVNPVSTENPVELSDMSISSIASN